MNKEKYKILFVCLGNICRSPMAETIMNKLIKENHLSNRIMVDSAGIIGFHAGEKADSRMRQHAYQRGYNITHISRPISISDFDDFDLIISMDESVYDSLLDKAPSIPHESKVVRMTDFCQIHTDATHVPDPYYGGASGFEHVIDLLEDSCIGLLKYVLED
ncbi:MAG: low molecular weight phosphotyrosine protein phosphatase [Bacteroidaceae bacterium]|nr:low molecular weight phosphotyrosine protein phosphatase [Bacteroidaceae bacterium]